MRFAIGIPLIDGPVAWIDWEDRALCAVQWSLRNGYAYRCDPRQGLRLLGGERALHRAILRPGPLEIVDHISGDRLDCRRANLRIASHSENMRNVGGSRRNSSSPLSGVVWNAQRNRWQASIRVDGKLRHLGLHIEIADANRARAEAEVVLWGVQPRRRAILEEVLGRTLAEQRSNGR